MCNPPFGGDYVLLAQRSLRRREGPGVLPPRRDPTAFMCF